MTATDLAIDLTEHGLVPDTLIRSGMRRLLRQRLVEVEADDCERSADAQHVFVQAMDAAPVAPLAHKANEQHYELPVEFFRAVLGPRLKYSCCYWPRGADTLEQAEVAALETTCERAGIEDGMTVLELGCGWGSLSLWLAEHYPHGHITAVSNSGTQRRFILDEAARRGLHNLDVVTRDMNDFDTQSRFDRVVSVEMFEHMRNYGALFRRIHDWLVPSGRFFLHIFSHRSAPYAFVDRDAGDWLTRHFFAGGIMPSDDLPLHFQRDLGLVRRWRWSGRHYQRTADAWLANLDLHQERIQPILAAHYGTEAARRWWTRWRLFFMACAELFGYDRGEQWRVSHYLFERHAR